MLVTYFFSLTNCTCRCCRFCLSYRDKLICGSPFRPPFPSVISYRPQLRPSSYCLIASLIVPPLCHLSANTDSNRQPLAGVPTFYQLNYLRSCPSFRTARLRDTVISIRGVEPHRIYHNLNHRADLNGIRAETGSRTPLFDWCINALPMSYFRKRSSLRAAIGYRLEQACLYCCWFFLLNNPKFLNLYPSVIRYPLRQYVTVAEIAGLLITAKSNILATT